MIDVLIADDQNFVRKTLESYLALESDLNIVGFAENGEVAINQVETLKPDIVLMDIEMPVMNGLNATKTISERFTNTKVLILSVHDKEQDVARALKFGAKGYWLKNTTPEELADAIRYVHKGYFQVALELVEKHYTQSFVADSDAAQDTELSRKLNLVDQVLAQIDHRLSSLDELTLQSLNDTVETIVKHEIDLGNNHNANLQFKVDRTRQQLNRLERKTNLSIKIQIVINVVLAALVGTICYFILNF